MTSLTATTTTEGNNPTSVISRQQQSVAVTTTNSGGGVGDVLLTQQFAECDGDADVGDKKHQVVAVVQNDVRGVVTNSRGEVVGNRENLEVVARRSAVTDRRSSSPFQNGRTELLIGNEENKVKTTAVVESNNNKLGVEAEYR